MDDKERAHVLSEALPHIKQYKDKTIVVKYGGNAMLSEEIKNAVLSDIVLLSLVGIKIVVVHGGGPEINEALEKMGIESRFVDGLRYTDKETLDVVQMVLCGKIGKSLTSQINRIGGRSIGLSGLDGGIIKATKMQGKDYGYVGEIKAVDTSLIVSSLEDGCIPVISTIAQGIDDDVSYNINADTAAAMIAESLCAESLILLTDVRGIMHNHNDENTLIPKLNISEIPSLIKEGKITGGMIPKIDCCMQALRRGVKKVAILDGRVEHSLLIELLTVSGFGTMITSDF